MFGSHGVGSFLVLIVELLAVVVGDVLGEEDDVLSVDLLEMAFVLSVVTSIDVDEVVNLVLVVALVFSVRCDVETIEIVAAILVFAVEADVINGFPAVLVRVVELVLLVFLLAVVSSEVERGKGVCFVETSVKVDVWVPDVGILLLLDVGWYVLVLPVVEVISFVEGDFLVVVVKVDDDTLVEVPLLDEVALPTGVLILTFVELVVVLAVFKGLLEVEASFVSVEFLNVTGIKVV